MDDNNAVVLHNGILTVKQKRHTPKTLSDSIPYYIDRDMPPQHAEFFSHLAYLPIATVDNQGRPWVTILTTASNDDPSVGIKLTGNNQLTINAYADTSDPFVNAILESNHQSNKPTHLFAGVGIDFTNRRRNKIAGRIVNAAYDDNNALHLTLNSNEHLGNCPKYITERSLVAHKRTPENVFDDTAFKSGHLPDAAKTIIEQASTVFLATKHIDGEQAAHMGVNHRGGAPGFVRILLENTIEGNGVSTSNTYLVLPDYSGNRFFQSLGNIQSDRLVGLVFPNFHDGALLYVTGEAENLYDDAAKALMPRITLLTKIKITGVVIIKQAMGLRLITEEKYSPYNVPVRYLKKELDDMGHVGSGDNDASSTNATLVSARKWTSSMTTFTFELEREVKSELPGSFGIFDFSHHLDTGYRHMNEDSPQSINDDFVRTWTLSSAPAFDFSKHEFSPTQTLSVTVKRKTNGLISHFLHELTGPTTTPTDRITVNYKGSGKGFSCFSSNENTVGVTIPPNMLWIAGGAGITPFMAMWQAIVNYNQSRPDNVTPLKTDTVLILAGRDDDVRMIEYFLLTAPKENTPVSMHIHLMRTMDKDKLAHAPMQTIADTPNLSVTLKNRRLEVDDLKGIRALPQREIYMCGPQGLTIASKHMLTTLLGEGLTVHEESYLF